MNEEPSSIKPLFHYTYKNEGVILDQKYNYQGNILAVCNSSGDIIFYSANGEEQNRQMLDIYDRKKGSEPKHAVLKISWSLPIFSLFAAATINRDIQIYACCKTTLKVQASKRVNHVPQALTFCPIETEPILAVGLSNGSILLLNDFLQQLVCVDAHEESVSCLAWDHKILSYQKNKWIMSNFSHMRRLVDTDEMPQLISASSDSWIKIWKYDYHKMTELYKKRAHQKAVRDVQWRHTYLVEADKYIISCSEDGTVKIWRVKIQQDKITDLQLKEARNFGGPVYRANFNFLGNVIAISYCNEHEQKVETIIMKQKNGFMMGEQMKIQV